MRPRGGRAQRGGNVQQSPAIENEKDRAGGKPCAVEKIELDLDDAKIVAFVGRCKAVVVSSTGDTTDARHDPA